MARVRRHDGRIFYRSEIREILRTSKCRRVVAAKKRRSRSSFPPPTKRINSSRYRRSNVCPQGQRAVVRNFPRIFAKTSSILCVGRTSSDDRPRNRSKAFKRPLENIPKSGFDPVAFLSGFKQNWMRATRRSLILHASKTPNQFDRPGGLGSTEIRHLCRVSLAKTWGMPFQSAITSRSTVVIFVSVLF